MTDQTADPELRVRKLMEITTALNAIFSEENNLLETRRPREIAPLQAEKARLAAAYAQSIRDVAANRAAIQSADNALLGELRAITASFEERAAHQRTLLEVARLASEGVVKAIADEATRAGPQGYGVQNSAKPAAISVNESA